MDYNKKKKEIEEKFEAIEKEVRILNNALSLKQQELLRLQGEYRLLLELEKEEKI